jgi:hypothetical protein
MTPVGLDNHPCFCNNSWDIVFYLNSLLLVTFSGLRPSDPRACNMWSIGCFYLPLHAIEEYCYLLATKPTSAGASKLTVDLLMTYRLWILCNVESDIVGMFIMNWEMRRRKPLQNVQYLRYYYYFILIGWATAHTGSWKYKARVPIQKSPDWLKWQIINNIVYRAVKERRLLLW